MDFTGTSLNMTVAELVCSSSERKITFYNRSGLDILRNMTHRGAEGADSKTGDGACAYPGPA